jgi:hypothetical protein
MNLTAVSIHPNIPSPECCFLHLGINSSSGYLHSNEAN